MSIKTTVSNTLPMPLVLFQDKFEAQAYATPTTIPDGDYCWCRAVCKYVLPVFSYTGIVNPELKKDYTDFPYYRIGSADTVVMKLYKDGTLVATLTNSTYGTFYDFGDLANTNLKGILLDWTLVHTAFGSGDYQMITTQTLFGTAYTRSSSYYRLMPYSDRAASGTVRIESYHNGLIEAAPFYDFTACNWYSQLRVWGNFGNEQPQFVTDNYISSDRQRKQIQDQINLTYTLEIAKMTGTEKDRFIKETLLANRIILTDYSLQNDDRYKAIEVYPDSIERLQYNGDRPGSHAVVKFKAKQENILKRNSSF